MTDHPQHAEVLDPEDTGPPPPMPANQLLLELDGTHSELTDAIAEVVRAVQDSGKAGSVTLKLTFAAAKLRDPAVLITPDITVKKPREPRDPSIRFTDDTGGLHRNNPRQAELPGLRDVNTPRRTSA